VGRLTVIMVTLLKAQLPIGFFADDRGETQAGAVVVQEVSYSIFVPIEYRTLISENNCASVLEILLWLNHHLFSIRLECGIDVGYLNCLLFEARRISCTACVLLLFFWGFCYNMAGFDFEGMILGHVKHRLLSFVDELGGLAAHLGDSAF